MLETNGRLAKKFPSLALFKVNQLELFSEWVSVSFASLDENPYRNLLPRVPLDCTAALSVNVFEKKRVEIVLVAEKVLRAGRVSLSQKRCVVENVENGNSVYNFSLFSALEHDSRSQVVT